MTVLVLALAGLDRASGLPEVTALLARGDAVTVATPDVASDVSLPAGVNLVTLGEREARHPVVRLEGLLTLRLLATVVAMVRWIPGPGARIRAREARGYRLAELVHRRWQQGPYRVIRPWLVWRCVRAEAGHLLDLTSYDGVVVADRASVTTGWQLARRFPGVPVVMRVEALAGGEPAEPGHR